MTHSAPPSSRRILIVEDASTCVETLEAALYRIPRLTLDFAGSAEDALEAIASASFAAIITDINLPGMSGIDLVSRLRSTHTAQALPIIVISGETDPNAPQSALAAGANAFFAKPFSPAAVRRALEELLNEK